MRSRPRSSTGRTKSCGCVVVVYQGTIQPCPGVSTFLAVTGLALEPKIGAFDTSQGFVLFRPGGPLENSPRRAVGARQPPPSAPAGAAEATPRYTARRRRSRAPSGK